ncbi:MAG: hypothetical protein LBK65_06915 [Tannerellaceae bacterium]|jgi:hypothetical protein|nr:hypothetical protein [Tannerellaceae bacterium]
MQAEYTNNSKKTPATPETRKALYGNMGKTIEMFSPILRQQIILQESLNKNELNPKSEIFNAFISLSIFSHYTNIELAAVLRACFRADLPAEKRYNIKWINCVILEAYKHLYGYGKKIKNSLWMSEVKQALRVYNDPELTQELNDLELYIIEFGEKKITDKKKRDLSFHYDLDPISVYNMLIELSEEDEVQRLISFMKLLDKIYIFISKHIGKYNITINNKYDGFSKYAFTLFELDIFHNKKDLLLSESEKIIQNNSQLLDEFILHQNIPAKMVQYFKKIDEESIASIYRLTEIEKVAMQLTFLYIDLASALRSFLTSEYVIERQLSLKQVNTIIYEGFNKLYLLSKNSEDSFWNMYICPLMSKTEDRFVLEKFNSLNIELQNLKPNIISYSDQRQLSVHLDKGISETYSMLHNMNPFEELRKSLLVFNFLPELLEFLTMCLRVVGLNSQIIHENKMASTYEQIDKIVELLKKSPDSQQKYDLIGKMKKIKTGELFDEIMKKKRK